MPKVPMIRRKRFLTSEVNQSSEMTHKATQVPNLGDVLPVHNFDVKTASMLRNVSASLPWAWNYIHILTHGLSPKFSFSANTFSRYS